MLLQVVSGIFYYDIMRLCCAYSIQFKQEHLNIYPKNFLLFLWLDPPYFLIQSPF